MDEMLSACPLSAIMASMKKKKNIVLRILCAMLFVLLSGIIMLSIYTLSSVRSESVTESLKQEVKDRLENTPEGVALSERIKGIVIRFSPYGSDWNANVRKLAHFSIYFALASMIYITLAILGCKKLSRIFLTVLACGVFAVFDELHQGDVMGRTMSKRDVLIDMLGACTAIGGLTVISIVYSLISWVGKGIFES